MASANSTPKSIKTTKQLENLKGKDSRYEVADEGCPGLRIRVQPSGTRTFIWRVRKGKGQQLVNLGKFKDDKNSTGLTLAQARSKLDSLKAQHEEGELIKKTGIQKTYKKNEMIDALLSLSNAKDPVSKKEDYLELAEGHIPVNVEQLAVVFYCLRIFPQRSVPKPVLDILRKEVIPAIGTRKLGVPISPPTIAAIVTKVVARDAATHAGKVLSVIKQLFRFGEGSGYCDNPAAALEARNLSIVNNVRQVSLDTEEIQAFWSAIDKSSQVKKAEYRLSDPIKVALKILLLSGVRSGELIKANWKDINFDKAEWFIPEENSKTTAWTVPLSSHLLRLFKQLKDYAGTSEWVLTGRSGHVTDKVLSKAMSRLYDIVDDDGNHILTIKKARPHDLRRTFRSHTDDLDIEPHVAEKCLNHSLGKMEAAYNTNKVFKKRREALEKWGDYVDLLTTERDNVTVLSA